MKYYLSFGGGVNSVALYLLLIDQGIDFEAIFVNHGTDWPETYRYVDMFQEKYPLTILKPDVGTLEGKRFSNLYEYYKFKSIIPLRMTRSCTDKFKIQPQKKYQKKPCFVFLGIAFDESHRAKIVSDKGHEYRYPLIENEITRQGCIDIIKKNGLPVPPKSGCYLCPFQPNHEFKRLRREEPCIFENVRILEKQYEKRRIENGDKPLYLKNIPIEKAIDENQLQLFKSDEYPPCQCGL